MRIQQPIPHWNNFTVPELKEILEHCRALEKLGIAQDGKMMTSIKRDITMREKTITKLAPFEPKLGTKQAEKRTITKFKKKEQPHELLLEQTA